MSANSCPGQLENANIKITGMNISARNLQKFFLKKFQYFFKFLQKYMLPVYLCVIFLNENVSEDTKQMLNKVHKSELIPSVV